MASHHEPINFTAAASAALEPAHFDARSPEGFNLFVAEFGFEEAHKARINAWRRVCREAASIRWHDRHARQELATAKFEYAWYLCERDGTPVRETYWQLDPENGDPVPYLR